MGDDGIETDCLFIAVKNDFITQFVSSLFEAGLSIERVAASSVLDSSAMRNVYGAQADNSLLVNVGARASNLIFFSENGLLCVIFH